MPLGHIPPETKLDDLVDRPEMYYGAPRSRGLWGDPIDDHFAGRKRVREPSPPRFSHPREQDNRLPSYSNGRGYSPHRDRMVYQEPLSSSTGSAGRLYDPVASPVQSPRRAPSVDSSSEQEGGALSKGEIISKMNTMDSEIAQLEEEQQALRQQKSLEQQPADKSTMPLAERVLAINQDRAAENRRYMALFQMAVASAKTKSGHVYLPDNATIHQLRRPVMLRHLKKQLLQEKRHTKNLVRVYEKKQRRWTAHLRAEDIIPPESVASLNNVLPPPAPVEFHVEPPGAAGTSRGRSRSGAVRSEAEFTQIMQQLNETERYDPNLRYLKTTTLRGVRL